MSAKRLMCSWIGVLVLTRAAFCQTYGPINVVVLPWGATLETHPASINKQGDIAGYYLDPLAAAPHGFVRTHEGCTMTGPICTPFTSIDALGFNSFTFPSSINDTGAITGYVQVNFPPPAGASHGFVRDPAGNITTFDPPGSISTMPRSMNAGGFITGDYNESNLVVHGFVREPSGHIISFDPPGSVSTTAVSINANGTITGFYIDANNRMHGFVRWPLGTIVSFDPPERTGTTVNGINNAGEITGSYTLANGRTFGFVRRPSGRFESFDAPGKLGVAAINDYGTITGSYSDSSGSHGFVRSREGVLTSFDPPGCFYFGGGQPTTLPTSINQEGVIIGSCLTGGVINFYAGFERIL